MIFLHPLFLAALVCVVVPVALHFLMRTRPKAICFPAVMFLKKREKSQKRALRLRHWLLLTLRMLLIAVLVLLFARPTFSPHGTGTRGNRPTAAIFLFDTSLRMDYRFENRTRLEVAKQEAGRILAALPSQSQCAVGANYLTPRAFLPDLSEVSRQIATLETSPAVRSLPALLIDTLPMFAKCELDQREVYIFTDSTRSAWAADAERLAERVAAFPGVRITLVDVGVESPQDSALELLTERGAAGRAGENATLRGLVHTHVAHPLRLALFTLDAAGQETLRAETSVQRAETSVLRAGNGGAGDGGAGGAERVAIPFTFELGHLPPGASQGYVQILGEDPLAKNDRCFFTVQNDPPATVLLAAREPAEEQAFFVRQALAPAGFVRENRARFDCSVVSFAELDRWLANPHTAGRSLGMYQSVWLLDPGEIEPAAWSVLAQYATGGGGVGIFLGPGLRNPATFQSTEARQVLPAVPDFQARFPDGTSIAPPRGTGHPVTRIFAQLGTPVPWDAFPVYRAWQVAHPAPDAQTVLTTETGTPILLEKPCGNGVVLLMTTPVTPVDSPADSPWNLLPQGESWIFLILMNQLGERLSGVTEARRNLAPLEPLAFPVGPEAEEKFTLRRFPESEPTVGFVETVLTVDLERRLLDIPPLEWAGNYRLFTGKGAFFTGFSVQYPPEFFALEKIPHDALLGLFGNEKLHPELCPEIVHSASELAQADARTVWGVDTFTVLGTLAFLLLLAEYAVAGRFYAR